MIDDQKKIKNIKDFQNLFPEKFDYLAEWFVRYKKYEGKKNVNYIMKNFMEIDRDQTVEIIKATHKSWVDQLKNNDYVYTKSE